MTELAYVLTGESSILVGDWVAELRKLPEYAEQARANIAKAQGPLFVKER